MMIFFALALSACLGERCEETTRASTRLPFDEQKFSLMQEIAMDADSRPMRVKRHEILDEIADENINGDTKLHAKMHERTKLENAPDMNPRTDPFHQNRQPDSRPSPFKEVYGADGKKYLYLQYMGQGGFGEVWSALGPISAGDDFPAIDGKRPSVLANTYKRNPKPCQPQGPVRCPDAESAIKISKQSKGELERKNSLDELWREVRTLKDLRDCGHVAQVIEAFQDRMQSYFITMQFLPGGELTDHIYNGKSYYTINGAMFLFYKLVNAVIALHGRNYAHRDLKPPNLMLARDFDSDPKIIDLGLSEIVDMRTRDVCGTPGYMSYEVWAEEHTGRSADVWALGVIFYEMLTGAKGKQAELPFRATEYPPKWQMQLTESHYQILKERQVPRKAIEICEGMLELDVQRRMTLAQVQTKLIVRKKVPRTLAEFQQIQEVERKEIEEKRRQEQRRMHEQQTRLEQETRMKEQQRKRQEIEERKREGEKRRRQQDLEEQGWQQQQRRLADQRRIDEEQRWQQQQRRLADQRRIDEEQRWQRQQWQADRAREWEARARPAMGSALPPGTRVQLSGLPGSLELNFRFGQIVSSDAWANPPTYVVEMDGTYRNVKVPFENVTPTIGQDRNLTPVIGHNLGIYGNVVFRR